MTSQERDQIFAAIDETASNLRGAVEAGSRVAKMFANICFELMEAQSETHYQSSPASNDSLMTIKELAVYLHVATRTIHNWRKKKDFPQPLRAGKDPRFDRREIDEWLERERKNSRAITAANGKVPPLQRDCKRNGSKNNVSL